MNHTTLRIRRDRGWRSSTVQRGLALCSPCVPHATARTKPPTCQHTRLPSIEGSQNIMARNNAPQHSKPTGEMPVTVVSSAITAALHYTEFYISLRKNARSARSIRINAEIPPAITLDAKMCSIIFSSPSLAALISSRQSSPSSFPASFGLFPSLPYFALSQVS